VEDLLVTAVFWLLVVAVVVNGILAGLSFDVAVVKLPTRRRIGALAYANFARGNDLGNGLLVYPATGVFAAVLVFGTTITAFLAKAPQSVLLPLVLASAATIAHSACTLRAAPIMLSLRTTPDDENLLAATLDQFAFWHGIRARFQFLVFVVLVWALIEGTSHP
jgi:hypothetical protein